MKGCCSLLVILGVAGAVLLADPPLRDRATSSLGDGVHWIEQHVAPSATPSLSPSPNPSRPELRPVFTPSPLFTPPFTPTSAPTQTAMQWTGGDCSYALSWLAVDRNLDADSSQSPDAQLAAYYAHYASEWLDAYNDARTYCNGEPMPASAAELDAVFATAMQTHLDDEHQHPENAWWDDPWITRYQRLEELWREAGA